MSERGKSSPRPYPPTAATAVPGGAPARSKRSSRVASTSSARRRAAHTPWWPGEYARSRASYSARSFATGSGAAPTRPLESVGTHLARPDPDELLDLRHPELAIPDLPGTGCLHDRVHDALRVGVVDHDLHADLRDEVDLVLRASIDLGVAALAPETLDVRGREAVHA